MSSENKQQKQQPPTREELEALRRVKSVEQQRQIRLTPERQMRAAEYYIPDGQIRAKGELE